MGPLTWWLPTSSEKIDLPNRSYVYDLGFSSLPLRRGNIGSDIFCKCETHVADSFCCISAHNFAAFCSFIRKMEVLVKEVC